jgi:predicted permease
MRPWRAWFAKLGGMFARRWRDREFDAEVASHLELHVDDNLRAGMTPQEARRQALLKLGGIEQTKQRYREQRGVRWLDELSQDARFGLRVLRKNPGFTLVCVMTLALGIGANTAIFSVIDGALLNPVPFPEPERLVDIYAKWPHFDRAPLSYPNFLDLQRDNNAFEGLAVWRIDSFTRTGQGDPQRLRGEMISANLLSVLGVRPVLGRTFRTEEDELGAAPVAMIGERLWKRDFGSDRKISGKSITLDGKDYTIIGVVPSSLHLLRYQNSFFDDVYLPVGQWDSKVLRDRGFSVGLRVVGRIRQGLSTAQAAEDVDRLGKNLAAEYRNGNDGLNIRIEPLSEDLTGNIRPTLLMLWAAVGLVLLIACANIATLLLARSTGRSHEFAVRSALGAGRGRIVRQFLAESALIVLGGGAAGVILADWGSRALLNIVPTAVPASAQVSINWRVLVFALGTSMLAGILFGIVPALSLSRTDPQDRLRTAGRGVPEGHHRVQSAFVAGEVGLALVLLIGAGLLTRSLAKVLSVDPGFDASDLLAFSVSLSPDVTASAERAHAVVRELTERVSTLPGVQAASVDFGAFPFEDDSEAPFWPEEKPKPANHSDWPLALIYFVGPDYFRTMSIPVIRGRVFTEQDDSSSTPVVVVDEDLANAAFPGEDPIGKQLNFGGSGPRQEIIGVVGHVKQFGLDENTRSSAHYQSYSSVDQFSGPLLTIAASNMSVLVRSERPAASLMTPIRKELRAVDPTAPIYGVRAMREIIGETLAERRFSMVLLGVFASFAVLLAASGIYGVFSYLVAQRTHEIGVRMALGARPWEVLRMVLGQGGTVALGGIAMGVLASIGLTRLMTSMLFGVSATDPVTFLTVVLILLTVALMACWIPARRAMRVDPMLALRHE